MAKIVYFFQILSRKLSTFFQMFEKNLHFFQRIFLAKTIHFFPDIRENVNFADFTEFFDTIVHFFADFEFPFFHVWGNISTFFKEFLAKIVQFFSNIGVKYPLSCKCISHFETKNQIGERRVMVVVVANTGKTPLILVYWW